MADTTPNDHDRSSHPTRVAVKDTLESVVIAFVLAFVFRAYVVEAFVIPTGSMAPTLLGEHLRVRCSQCGYRFSTDRPQRSGNPHRRPGAAICPMCHHRSPVPSPPPTRAGDRILVHKFIYEVSSPRRWDVVVFKNPSTPDQNYIKRLVGLPGENLLVVEGNVYVKPNGTGEDAWRIARKTDRSANRHALRIQRGVWQPVYHSQYVPLDGGVSAVGASGRREVRWRTPWHGRTGDWVIDGRYTYRHESSGPGDIVFDFASQRVDPVGWYPYNQYRPSIDQPIEDVRLAATFQPDREGLAVELRTTARLDQKDAEGGPLPVVARLDPSGRATLEAADPADPRRMRLLDEAAIKPFRAGLARRVELWYVDQELTVWVDDRCLLRWSFDLDMRTLLERPALEADAFPSLAISVTGAPVSLHRVEVDRDLAYTSSKPDGSPGLGTVLKNRSTHPPNGTPEPDPRAIEILADQYFCMGDNSPLSHDGRFWVRERINPWVRETMLPDADHQQGVVPARLMIGRAFFVYFPATYPIVESGMGVLPNFGDMRFIH